MALALAQILGSEVHFELVSPPSSLHPKQQQPQKMNEKVTPGPTRLFSNDVNVKPGI